MAIDTMIRRWRREIKNKKVEREPGGSVCPGPERRCLRNFPRRADTDTSPSAPTSPGYGSGENTEMNILYRFKVLES